MGLELRLARSATRLTWGWGGDVCLEVAVHLGRQSSGWADIVCIGLEPQLARPREEQSWGWGGVCLEVAVHLGRQPRGGQQHTLGRLEPRLASSQSGQGWEGRGGLLEQTPGWPFALKESAHTRRGRRKRRRRQVTRGCGLARWGARKRSRGTISNGGLITYSGLLRAGDIKANPGPDDYQVKPPLIPLILAGLQFPAPIGDAFARPHNALFRQPWGPQGDSMSRSWRTSLLGPLWLNPPFHMLGDVERKIREEGAYVILICPGWRSVLPCLMALSKRHF